MIASLVFYMFALALIFSATMTVTVRQPVHAVLFLIWSFFNGAGLMLTMGAEFLAFIILIVYIGAVAVLFLFVVMMLDVKGQTDASSRLCRSLPVGLGVGGALLAQMLAVAKAWPEAKSVLPEAGAAALSNTKALGRVLYTASLYPFEVCGLILLVAMVGAIALTLRETPRRDVKRQKAREQISRTREESVELRSVEKEKGAL